MWAGGYKRVNKTISRARKQTTKMHLFVQAVAFYFSLLLFIPSNAQFYRGALEPRYSRKTPFRQQTEIPEPVFGIGHGARRFNRDKSREDSPSLSPFFGQRREPERRNSGRADGRDYEENGDEFGRRPPHEFGRHEDDEEQEEGRFEPGRGNEFKRPKLPDSSEVRDIFDAERERGGRKEEPPKRRAEDHENEEMDDKEEEEADERKERPRNEENEEEDSHRGHHRDHEEPEEQETETVAETPSKVVGLNMQMVAGVYPKEKKGPEVEDVEKRGGRFVEKPDERERNKFFRKIDQQLEEILVKLRKEAKERSGVTEDEAAKSLSNLTNQPQTLAEKEVEKIKKKEKMVEEKENLSNLNFNSSSSSRLHHLPTPKSLRSLLSPNSQDLAASSLSNLTTQLDHSVELPDAKERLEKTLTRVKSDLARTDDVFTNRTQLLLHPSIRVPMMSLPNGEIPAPVAARVMRENEEEEEKKIKGMEKKKIMKSHVAKENIILERKCHLHDHGTIYDFDFNLNLYYYNHRNARYSVVWNLPSH
ncbi:unnamed protein product [Caenorhabditis sp. 36 PRJEB53466]|nr:unnamed protein product [Caenorhabditis sp. 36 PRJEB53466]